MSLTYSLLAPAAILISGLLAWLYHRKISARRATLNFCAQAELNSKEWRENRELFFSLVAKGNQGLLDLVTKQSPDPYHIRYASRIALYLNHFELVAAAIKERAMDERMYKILHQDEYVWTWKHAEAYIAASRHKASQPRMYENFEALAKKWD